MSLRRGKPGGRAATDSRQGWLLAICCGAQFMVILDLSIVNVALPSIQSSLGFSSIDLQWVVDAYAVVFAGFLMLAGRATDQFGQRRTLVTALLIFALASLAGGTAPDQTLLIVARGVQGFGGAMMAAGSLAAITSAFAEGAARHRAIGLWGAMNGAGGAAGVFFGGVITQDLGWRWILLVNTPIAAATAVGAYIVVADQRNAKRAARFDFGGALALTGGLLALVYGIVTAGYLGWGAAKSLTPIVIGIALLALVPLIEARFASAPLVPPGSLTKHLRRANGIVLLFSAALFPMWYVTSLYLQQVLGLSPISTGLTFLPMALAIMVTARVAGRLVGRFGVRSTLGSGLVLMASGLLLFARIGASGSAVGFVVLPGVLVAIGIGLSVVASTIAATQGAQPGQAGLASGLVNTARQVGGAIGIALLISLASQHTSHLIGQNRAVPDALTDGFRLAYLIGAGLCGLAAVCAGVLLPRPAPRQAGAVRSRLAVGVLVVVACFAAVDFAFAGAPGAPIGAYTTRGAYMFVSAPNLHPPEVRAGTTAAGPLAPGYIMIANFYDLTSPPIVGQSGPLILDSRLQPVWFRPVPTDLVASNLSVQIYDGKPALAWWQGVITSTGATETGEDVVVDQHYRTVATLKGTDGWIITLHELQIRGDYAWVTANKNIPMNLSKYGGANNGALVDSAVQEYDLKTGRLVYSWDAFDHIPLSDSYALPPTNGFPWDAYHVNSINLESDGTMLVSLRNTWAAYHVTIGSGKIDWTLGGKHSSFKLAQNARFEWQHDVAPQGSSEVSLFDDDCCQLSGAGVYLAPAGPSRGLVLKLDQANHTATLVSQYVHGGNFDAAYMGNVQLLGNGNVFVGWGSQPYFSEYTKRGKLLLEGVLPSPDLTYRATRDNWTGLPLGKPSAVAQTANGKTTVYASWNGATKLASWRVMAGRSATQLDAVATATKSGFETAISVPAGYRVFQVQALGAFGQVIGTSRTTRAQVRVRTRVSRS